LPSTQKVTDVIEESESAAVSLMVPRTTAPGSVTAGRAGGFGAGNGGPSVLPGSGAGDAGVPGGVLWACTSPTGRSR